MKEENIKVDLNEMERFKEQNMKDRRWFIKYWVDYIKTHSDTEWSKQQKVLIDSQIESARHLAGKNKIKKKQES